MQIISITDLCPSFLRSILFAARSFFVDAEESLLHTSSLPLLVLSHVTSHGAYKFLCFHIPSNTVNDIFTKAADKGDEKKKEEEVAEPPVGILKLVGIRSRNVEAE